MCVLVGTHGSGAGTQAGACRNLSLGATSVTCAVPDFSDTRVVWQLLSPGSDSAEVSDTLVRSFSVIRDPTRVCWRNAYVQHQRSSYTV